MKLQTFYNLFYKHRVSKARIILKLYLLIIIPIRYLLNIVFFKKKINLDNYEKDNLNLYDKDLNFLLEYFNSDKGEKFYDQYVQPIKRKKNIKIAGHGYASFYERYFLNFKKKNINILELGSFYGNASAALYFYFKESDIFSADIYPDLFSYKSKRIKNFYIDTSSENSIEKNLINKNYLFDIIIEDASHMYKDQIISLFMLFPILNSNGIFIVEELDFPDTRKDMNLNNEKPTLRDILNKTLDKEDFNNQLISNEQKKYFLENFKSIKIFKGKVNEVAIIEKK